jgi:L-2-hydroxyglutarate oxidase LhgO
MQRESTDTVVIGAGVIGLAVARRLAMGGSEVLLLETHDGIGRETSSRNSEVIHAGLYYPPDSLKAETCIHGSRMLYGYSKDRGVPLRRCGKLIAATDEEQIKQLHLLLDNALACGVDGLELIDRPAIADMESELRAEAAIFSPATGIIDSHALMLALQADFEAAGGLVALNTRVVTGRVLDPGFELGVDSGGVSWIRCRRLVNAAGLRAQRLAASITGFPAEHLPEVQFVRGQYFTYPGPPPFSRLVYPLPGPSGLGIHATPDLAGAVRFGPDQVPVADPDYDFDYDFDAGARARFAASIRPWYPGLEEDRLQAGLVGIRPRLAPRGEGFADFRVSGPDTHEIPGLVMLFGIESPGLTACLALAERVSDDLGPG